MSLMAMKLTSMGLPAVSLCGWQAGIETCGEHGNARITNVLTERIEKELKDNKIVVVAGFQGINENGDITTIGRGGSDTTAAALAAALHADKCVIYTDVCGVYSADPRIAENASLHEEIGYDEMLEMASLGAGVLHNRSVEIAKKNGLVLKVMSSFQEGKGTEIKSGIFEDGHISGVAADKNTSLIEILGGNTKSLPKVLRILAKEGICSDMMTDIENRLGFTVPRARADKAVKCLSEKTEEIDAISVKCNKRVSKVSLIGCGLAGDPEIGARMLTRLEKEKIEVKSVVASEIKISMLVADQDADKAVAAIHNEFFGSVHN